MPLRASRHRAANTASRNPPQIRVDGCSGFSSRGGLHPLLLGTPREAGGIGPTRESGSRVPSWRDVRDPLACLRPAGFQGVPLPLGLLGVPPPPGLSSNSTSDCLALSFFTSSGYPDCWMILLNWVR